MPSNIIHGCIILYRYNWLKPVLSEHTVWEQQAEKHGLASQFHYLNVTHHSRYRADSHVDKNYHGVTDCVHWCLPGVPDTWNWLLYNLITNGKKIIR